MEFPGTTPHDRARILLAKLLIAKGRLMLIQAHIASDTPEDDQKQIDTIEVAIGEFADLSTDPLYTTVTDQDHQLERSTETLIHVVALKAFLDKLESVEPGYGIDEKQIALLSEQFSNRWGIPPSDSELSSED